MNHEPDHTHDDILDQQPKPTAAQVAWVLAHFADMCTSKEMQSYGFVMQRMYGFPSAEKIIASEYGLTIANTINNKSNEYIV